MINSLTNYDDQYACSWHHRNIYTMTYRLIPTGRLLKNHKVQLPGYHSAK